MKELVKVAEEAECWLQWCRSIEATAAEPRYSVTV
jgi:hypothetical protein